MGSACELLPRVRARRSGHSVHLLQIGHLHFLSHSWGNFAHLSSQKTKERDHGPAISTICTISATATAAAAAAAASLTQTELLIVGASI